jgi:hypothetical protein
MEVLEISGIAMRKWLGRGEVMSSEIRLFSPA